MSINTLHKGDDDGNDNDNNNNSNIIIIMIIGGLALYLPTGRCNREMANTRMRNFALHKQRSPIHQPCYGQFALTKVA